MEGSKNGSIFERLLLLIKTSFIFGLLRPSAFPVPIPERSSFDDAWESSRIFRLLDWLVNLLPSLFGRLYRSAKPVFEGSAVFAEVAAWSDHTGILSGVFMALVLAVPQKYWNNYFSLAGTLVLCCLLAVKLARRGGRVRTEGVSAWLLIFLASVFAAFLFSASRRLSLRFLVFHATDALLVLVLLSSLTDRKELKGFFTGLAAGLAIAALYGCYQWRTGVDVVLWQVDTDANADMPGRVYSFFENPNVFAEVLIILTPFVWVQLMESDVQLERILWLAVLGAAIIAMAATYSRGGWIGLVVAILVFTAFKNWKLIPVFIILGIAALPLLPKTIYNRLMTLASGGDSTITSRYITYDSAKRLLSDNLISGVGLGTDVPQSLINGHSYYSNGLKFIHSHNTFVQIWLEMGIVGLLSFVGGIINWFKRAGAQVIAADGPRDIRNYIAAGVSGIIGVLIFGIVDYVWFYPRVMLIFWASVGATAAAYRLADAERKGKRL